ncbi:hypothetical protein HPB48_007377 [Haemaphysalis longicornis]|uniref:DNA-directed RNA polymerase III subunit n=1 Tax=Haemaphysalis longicornis TaxID=44386 RepID=A0A9J6FVX4_HAELO|nr:hypothetical protein HPB48_007377 [Haemaphysalis longicornis]
MAGRGGRGRGGRGRGTGLSFNVEQLGLTRQEAAVTLSLQPPPTFPVRLRTFHSLSTWFRARNSMRSLTGPKLLRLLAACMLLQPLDFSPAPLVHSEENTYLAVLLREQRRSLRESGFNVEPCTPPQIVERYSDRYQAPKAPEIAYDMSYFPSELKISKKKKKARKSPLKSSKGCDAIATGIDIQKKLQALEETEGKAESGEEEEEATEKKPKDADDEDGEEAVEDIDEEELEEETDYVSGYFDNGEGYLEDEEDNLDDGAVY